MEIIRGIKQYLQQLGYQNIFRGVLPDMPDRALALYLDEAGATPDGMVAGRLHVIARARSLEEALMTAQTVTAELDSGLNERVFRLPGGGSCVARPAKWPVSIGPDNRNRAQAAAEVMVFYGG